MRRRASRETVAGHAGAFQDEVAGKRVCVLVDDGSRDEPLVDVLPHLCGVLRGAASVQFLICTGTHTADTPKNRQIGREIEKASRDAGLNLTRVHAHDCQGRPMSQTSDARRGGRRCWSMPSPTRRMFFSWCRT